MEQTVFEKILSTGEADLFIGTSSFTEQTAMLGRLFEAVGELASSVAHETSAAADAIGWCIVALTILAAQLKLDVAECIPEPYSGIKDGKGRIENGVFIREEPAC